jgi:hypothetical protein
MTTMLEVERQAYEEGFKNGTVLCAAQIESDRERGRRYHNQLIVQNGYVKAERVTQLEAENAELQQQLAAIQGALADAGNVLAERVDGNYGESVRELTRERDELLLQNERLRSQIKREAAIDQIFPDANSAAGMEMIALASRNRTLVETLRDAKDALIDNNWARIAVRHLLARIDAALESEANS